MKIFVSALIVLSFVVAGPWAAVNVSAQSTDRIDLAAPTKPRVLGATDGAVATAAACRYCVEADNSARSQWNTHNRVADNLVSIGAVTSDTESTISYMLRTF